MFQASETPQGIPYIRNPFDNPHRPTVQVRADLSNQIPSFPAETPPSGLHIMNPFKNMDLSNRLRIGSQIVPHEISGNPLYNSDLALVPNFKHDAKYSLRRDKMAYTIFEKCKLIREKTKELADLTFLQTDLQSKHQARINELEKRNSNAMEELQRNEVRIAEISSIQKESKEISSRISYLTDSKKKLEANLHGRVEKKKLRQQQIQSIITEKRGKIDQIKHEIAIKSTRKQALQIERHNKTVGLISSTAAIDLSNASQLLSKKMFTSESRRNILAKEKSELNVKNEFLNDHKETITSSIERLRKIKALNERLKLLTNNFKDRIALSQAGRISKFGESIANGSSNSILESSIDKISSAVTIAKSHLVNNQATIAKYRENVSRLTNFLIGDSEKPAMDENQMWKQIFEKFCENRMQYAHLRHDATSSEIERNDKVDSGTDTCVFDAKSGLDLVLNTECQPTETKDYMNDASIYHTDSIWVFQEPKSEIFEQPHRPVETADLDFLKDCKKAIETTDYPLPDNENLRTPSRKRFYPQTTTELPCDASVALFDWESVLPPSPHDKPSPGVSLSMDFLHD